MDKDLYGHCIHNYSNGVVTGTAQIQQFPNSAVINIIFKADHSNKGITYLGANGYADFPLAAGEDTGWMCAANLNSFYYRYAGQDKIGILHFWCEY